MLQFSRLTRCRINNTKVGFLTTTVRGLACFIARCPRKNIKLGGSTWKTMEKHIFLGGGVVSRDNRCQNCIGFLIPNVITATTTKRKAFASEKWHLHVVGVRMSRGVNAAEREDSVTINWIWRFPSETKFQQVRNFFSVQRLLNKWNGVERPQRSCAELSGFPLQTFPGQDYGVFVNA